MQESIRSTLALVIIVSIVATAVSWFAMGADIDGQTWAWRVGSPACGILALLVFLKIHLREDAVPDFLARRCKNFFERDGFCFTVVPAVRAECCFLDVFFQNRYANRSEATVMVAPSRGFILAAKLRRVVVEIHCAPAAFGVARCRWPIPSKYQGKKQSLDVAATVRYPEGRGRLLRSRCGIYVGRVTNTLGIEKPAHVKLRLPLCGENDEDGDGQEDIQIETLWELEQHEIQEEAT
ncbi:MAG: hypothetical protein JXB62_12740 [Pirellulales bacterium]|nr:hypothetical protein [Pirellulales bacterium]